MQFASVGRGRVLAAAALAVLLAPSLAAAENGVRPVAETLGPRAAAPAGSPEGGDKSALSDSAVRVIMTYAFSIIPDEIKGPDGKPVKVDKSNPNEYLIPTDEARSVIRVATRSAYAEVCGVLDLARANYLTFIKGEEARKAWSEKQLIYIKALHMFSVSYFTGNLMIKTEEEDVPAPDAAAGGATAAQEPAEAGPDQAPAEAQTFKSKRPECPPAQKEKVTKAINAYVQAANAGSAKEKTGSAAN